MIFTSGTQVIQKRTVNHDHYPYEIYYDGHASGEHCRQEIPPHYEVGHELRCMATVYAPRAEFTVLDNPILAKYRETDERTRWHMRQGSWISWPAMPYPDGAADHARAVLRRLARLEATE